LPGRPFRFIHAGDFHLETPWGGLVEVPEQLRAALIDSPYAAATRVFDAALAEEADFLVLSGDILHVERAGPRGPAFLAEQFSRLAERGIAVYWAGGELDPPEAWPAAFPLPQCVRLFPRGRVSELVHLRDGAAVARLAGVSRDGSRPLRPAEFDPDPAGLFTIGVAHGEADAAALSARGIHYWALGGRHDRDTPLHGPTVAHWPGSPQGRRPEEPGVHGCTLVKVDQEGQARLSLIATDTVRWLAERVVVEESAGAEGLEAALHQRARTLIETMPGVALLVAWSIAYEGFGDLGISGFRDSGIPGQPAPSAFRLPPSAVDVAGRPLVPRPPSVDPLGATAGLSSSADNTVGQANRATRHFTPVETLDRLRGELADQRPGLWSVSLEVEPPATLPAEWYEQDTILGDFLRAIRQYELNASEPVDLESYMSEAHRAGALGHAATLADSALRRGVLSQAALLGAELLAGDPAQALATSHQPLATSP
jgi:hypothetical protein